jgi:heptosyltransferase-2
MNDGLRPPPGTGPRVLVVVPNWLGDLVMATPLLDDLAAGGGQRPAITVAVRRCWEPLLADDPRIDQLICYERSGRHRGISGAWHLAADWRRGDFAAVVLTPPSLRVALVARLAGIRLRIGYRTDGRRWLLSHSLPLPARGSQHHSEELRALGTVVGQALALPRPAATEKEPSPLPSLPALAAVPPAAVGEGPVCWLIGVGATYGTAKAWPAERVAELLRLGVQTHGVRAVLVGTAAARAEVERVRGLTGDLPWRHALPGAAAVVDLTGRTNLRELVALLRAAAGYIGNDSGPMHLAAALGVPTVGVFGSSSPHWTGPRGSRTAVVTASGFPCHPCFLRECPQERFCLATVAAEDVAERLLAIMAAGQAGRAGERGARS